MDCPVAPADATGAPAPHEDVFVGYGRCKDHVGALAARLLVPLGDDRSDIEAYSVLCVFGAWP